MKKLELRQLIKEEITSVLKETRSVWKGAEYEEISSSLDDISKNLFVFDEEIKKEIKKYLNRIQGLVYKFGTEEID